VDLGFGVAWCAGAGTAQATPPAQTQPPQGRRGGPPLTPEQIAENERRARLRGEYSRYRANNDLLYYHLDVESIRPKSSSPARTPFASRC
jgi:hypothetical protein